jgi:hypothetical protein
MSAVTIQTNIPATLIVLSSELIERIDALVIRSIDMPVTDYASTKPADIALKEMSAMVKEIEAGRKSLTAPLDAIKAQAIEAERMGTLPLQGAIKALQVRVAAAVTAHNTELSRLAALALAEQQRLQAIENTAAEERRKALQEAAEMAALPGEEPAEVSVIAELPKQIVAAWTPPPVKSSAVRASTEYTLVFSNRDLIPAFSASGHELRTIDEGALEKFLKSLPEGKQEIPGVKLVKSAGTAAKG